MPKNNQELHKLRQYFCKHLNMYWTTEAGKRILVCDLEDSHIINILKKWNGETVYSEEKSEALTHVIEEAEFRFIEQKCNFKFEEIDYE